MTEVPDRSRWKDYIAARKRPTLPSEIAIGAAAAVIAVGIRFALPVRPDQLPTALVVILLAVVTTFVGLRAGIVTALLGGLGSWYLFFNQRSWSLDNEAWIPVLGYVVVAVVILTTSQLYRTSQQAHHEKEIARLEAEAETSKLFARELTHRLGNTLAIVQSIALQTMGKDNPDSRKFAGRLRALAEANRLLTEHVETPTANVTQVIETALSPFRNEGQRIRVESIDATIQTQQVLSLALALHELATNALKYGALSMPDGLVTLRVDDVDDHLDLTWKENNGPPVKAPDSHGFGTKVLLRSGVTTGLEFEPDGVRCSMSIPKAALA